MRLARKVNEEVLRVPYNREELQKKLQDEDEDW